MNLLSLRGGVGGTYGRIYVFLKAIRVFTSSAITLFVCDMVRGSRVSRVRSVASGYGGNHLRILPLR